MQPDLIGVVLAGGQSRRMGGGDKSLLGIGGQPMLGRVIARLAPQVGTVVLNANGDLTRFNEFDLPITADSLTGYAGPLAGVLSGMDWAAARGASHIVTAAADTPFFPADLVARLRAGAAASGHPLAMAMTPDAARGMSRHPTFTLWPVNLRDDLRAALGSGLRKIVAWTDAQGCANVVFDTAPFDPFFNVNTPADMEVATRMVREHGL